MLFGYLTLFTSLILSASAAVYSILGLTAIFASAFWPIVIMGGSLEFGKIVTTLWLHKYWDRAGIQYKIYLCSAVAILMLLTSMGVFGFLSKAHSDQSLVSGDVTAKIALYDEKIKVSKENIDANRRALKQMDEAVDQVMGRSTTEAGAGKAVQIRRAQTKERQRILADIETEQKKITALAEERAPIAAEVRKVEAEVGPIKYIAAMIYGDNPDANLLEKSVRWVIILIVVVFDPLALTLLVAATKTFEWERDIKTPNLAVKEEIAAPVLQEDAPSPEIPTAVDIELELDPLPAPLPVKPPPFYSAPTQFWPFSNHSQDLQINQDSQALVIDDDAYEAQVSDSLRDVIKQWKLDNPDDTLKHQRYLLDNNKITELPWVTMANARKSNSGFGAAFPDHPVKGDTFLRVDQMPSVLYKFNGDVWIKVDKSLSDNYTYDTAYINHLIEQLSTGELDLDLLSESEREQVTQQLQSKTS